MRNHKLTILRIQKQQKKIDEDPVPNVLVARKGLLNFHFCIYGLQAPFKGGYYHGLLQLHQDYPFSPPKLLFYTPSGRFETGKPICTSFTNYHKETWTSAWNVRTMLTATVSFMTSDQAGVGGLNDNYFTRQSYAQKSLSWNMRNQEFCDLFKQKLLQHNITINQNRLIQSPNSTNKSSNQANTMANNNSLYLLYIVLVIVLLIWAFIR